MFLDTTKIDAKAGNGGDGMISFRREKYVPRGGPDGGNGGRGGDVIIEASHNLHTLYDIAQSRFLHAGNGQPGGTSLCTGRNGEDAHLLVPVGTLVKNAETGELIADMREDGKIVVVAKGGKGGLGNTAFKTATKKAPRRNTPGQPGEAMQLSLELKLMADVGLVGFPNAGKSSLVGRISDAHPKVGDYPFTTLKPSLGVVRWEGGRSFVVADIPGLLEGAAEGKGLGHQFLRHIERTSCLAFVIDLSEEDPWKQYAVLRGELKKFQPLLLEKPKVILLNKTDLGDFSIDSRFKKERCSVVLTSAATGAGLVEARKAMAEILAEKRNIQTDGW